MFNKNTCAPKISFKKGKVILKTKVKYKKGAKRKFISYTMIQHGAGSEDRKVQKIIKKIRKSSRNK